MTMTTIRLAILTAILTLISGCNLLNVQDNADTISAFSVDAGSSYCKAAGNSVASKLEARALVRAQIGPELKSENMELCLGCPGDAQTFCSGEERPKVR